MPAGVFHAPIFFYHNRTLFIYLTFSLLLITYYFPLNGRRVRPATIFFYLLISLFIYLTFSLLLITYYFPSTGSQGTQFLAGVGRAHKKTDLIKRTQFAPLRRRRTSGDSRPKDPNKQPIGCALDRLAVIRKLCLRKTDLIKRTQVRAPTP